MEIQNIETYNSYKNFCKEIKINDLLKYIISNINVNVITVYHIIIGAKMYKFIDDPSQSMQNTNPRNHEFPKIVKNLFINPDKQFSPELYYNLSNFANITINQVVLLIDPMFKKYKQIEGFDYEMSLLFNNLPDELIKIHNINHNDFKNTIITTKIEPIIIPDSINEQQITNLIEIIDSFGRFCPMLLNIMDCSSNTIRKLYADNSSNTSKRIYITHPNCLIIDGEMQYLPIITLDSISKNFNNSILNEEQSINQNLSIRWTNYEEDSKLIIDLQNILDVCPYSNNTLNFIFASYKEFHLNISLVGICKLWSITRITKEFEFETPDSNNSLLPITKFTFSTLPFKLFIKYWNSYKNFRDILTFKLFDNYYIHNVVKFINIMIEKYKNYEEHNNLIIYGIDDILKIEAYEIFSNFKKYFPKENIEFEISAYNIKQFDIINYIKNNGVYL